MRGVGRQVRFDVTAGARNARALFGVWMRRKWRRVPRVIRAPLFAVFVSGRAVYRAGWHAGRTVRTGLHAGVDEGRHRHREVLELRDLRREFPHFRAHPHYADTKERIKADRAMRLGEHRDHAAAVRRAVAAGVPAPSLTPPTPTPKAADPPGAPTPPSTAAPSPPDPLVNNGTPQYPGPGDGGEHDVIHDGTVFSGYSRERAEQLATWLRWRHGDTQGPVGIRYPPSPTPPPPATSPPTTDPTEPAEPNPAEWWGIAWADPDGVVHVTPVGSSAEAGDDRYPPLPIKTRAGDGVYPAVKFSQRQGVWVLVATGWTLPERIPTDARMGTVTGDPTYTISPTGTIQWAGDHHVDTNTPENINGGGTGMTTANGSLSTMASRTGTTIGGDVVAIDDMRRFYERAHPEAVATQDYALRMADSAGAQAAATEAALGSLQGQGHDAATINEATAVLEAMEEMRRKALELQAAADAAVSALTAAHRGLERHRQMEEAVASHPGPARQTAAYASS